MKKILLLSLICFFVSNSTFAQQTENKGVVEDYKNEFWEKIENDLEEYYSEKEEPRMKFTVKMDGLTLPTSIDQFTTIWHQAPHSQGKTGTCWDYSATSFLESEIYRQHAKDVKISEMHTVYYEYVEKARRYIQKRGDSRFVEGSQSEAAFNIWKKYGVVPADLYLGRPAEQPFHDHSIMFAEMEAYLESLKITNIWNEKEALSTIKAILNHYMGTPPSEVTVDGKTYTPKEYLYDYLAIDPTDFIGFISIMEEPYFTKAAYDVPDNWYFSEEYHNVPLDDYMNIISEATANGYTVSIGGDISEAGYCGNKDVAIIPSFDIPSEYIDENARQFRFSNTSSKDDHLLHIVGYADLDGKRWYLIKDSASSSFNGNNKGYYFYHEDYIKLKILAIWVHRDAVEEILNRF